MDFEEFLKKAKADGWELQAGCMKDLRGVTDTVFELPKTENPDYQAFLDRINAKRGE